MRQLREDRDGNRYPLLRDGKAIIEVLKDDKFIIKTTDDEIIAITPDYNEAYKRALRADRNAIVLVKLDGNIINASEYYGDMPAPIVFRIDYYEGKYGFVAAVDVIKDGTKSDITVFYDDISVRSFILNEVEGRQDYLIVFSHRKLQILDGLGNDQYTYNFTRRDFSHLRTEVEKYKKELKKNYVENEGV